ncbi:YciI family protein [Hydrogenophaga sp. RWCD_12]|uniref:YciI family protein n=1 Tax=Hydrogenophaga sp. RWCD_12 TaxID=3391190 RepID=UPI0039854334
MQYMLMFFDSAENQTPPADPAQAKTYMGAWGAYIGALHAAGVVVNGHGLQPRSTATTLRLKDGQRQVQDGPFADTKEQLGGYFVIDVPTLDDALGWAARCPVAATGAVEVRPVMVVPAGLRPGTGQ